MNKIYFATGNEGKIKEARAILGIEIEPLSLSVPEIQTLDPIICAEKKAEYAYSAAKKPLLVEDTSLIFESWNGLPGVFIDYFMKTLDVKGILKLMKYEKNRKAYAQTTYSFFDGKEKITVFGKIEGKISKTAKGANGFGWDSIFVPEGKTKTFAEMSDTEKNMISMRKIALMKLKRKLSLN